MTSQISWFVFAKIHFKNWTVLSLKTVKMIAKEKMWRKKRQLFETYGYFQCKYLITLRIRLSRPYAHIWSCLQAILRLVGLPATTRARFRIGQSASNFSLSLPFWLSVSDINELRSLNSKSDVLNRTLSSLLYHNFSLEKTDVSIIFVR